MATSNTILVALVDALDRVDIYRLFDDELSDYVRMADSVWGRSHPTAVRRARRSRLCRRSTMLESYIVYLVNLARRAIERHDYVSFVGIDEQYCKITSYALCVLHEEF